MPWGLRCSLPQLSGHGRREPVLAPPPTGPGSQSVRHESVHVSLNFRDGRAASPLNCHFPNTGLVGASSQRRAQLGSAVMTACALRSEHSPSLDAAPSTSMWAAVSTSLWAHLSVGLCLDWFTGCEPESYASPDRWKQLQRAPGSPGAKARCGHDDDIPSRWDDDEDWGPCYTPPPGHRTIAANPRSALRTPGSTASRRSAAAALRSVSFSCDKVRELATVASRAAHNNLPPYSLEVAALHA